MGHYSKQTDARGVVRYRDENKNQLTGKDNVPEEVRTFLEGVEDGVKVVATEVEGKLQIKAEEAEAPTPEAPAEETPEEEAPAAAETDDSDVEETVPDPAGEGEEDEEDETDDDSEEGDGIDTEMQAPAPTVSNESGMGFPMNKQGRTLSIFSKKVHETVKYINGMMVPMTMDEYKSKSDKDIMAKLKKLGKL